MFWSTMKADQCKAKQAICTLLVKNRQGLRLAIFQSWGIFASSSLVFPMRSGQIIGWLAALTSSLTHHRSRTENLPHLTGEQSPAEYLSTSESLCISRWYRYHPRSHRFSRRRISPVWKCTDERGWQMTYAFNSIFRWAFVVLHKWKIILRYPSDYGAYRSIITTIRYCQRKTKNFLPTSSTFLSAVPRNPNSMLLSGSLDFLAF